MEKDVRKKTLDALKTARGQLDGIIKMVEEDRYCIDVSKQILSSAALLRKANLVVLRGHVKSCVSTAIRKGDAERKIEEIFGIIDKYAKMGS